MSAGQWFWIVYVILGLFGGYIGFANDYDRRWIGGGFVMFVLIGLLGWMAAGPPIH